MSLLHKHNWEVITTTRCSPIKVTEAATYPELMARRIVWGSVTKLLQCTHCGKLETVELFGDEIDESKGLR